MELKITFFKHLKALSILLIILFISSSIILYLGLNIKSVAFIFISFFIILVLPTVYIHLNYFNEGKGYTYEINENEISVSKDGHHLIFNKENFKIIEYYMSGTKLSGQAIRNFPFEGYFYAKIIMNDGNEVVLSCLFSMEIDKILTSYYKDIPITKIKDFYPLIQDK
jgi:hypothetical protein